MAEARDRLQILCIGWPGEVLALERQTVTQAQGHITYSYFGT